MKGWLQQIGLIIGVIGAIVLNVKGQDSNRYISGFSAQLHGGEILIHSKKMSHFTSALTGSAEVSYLWQTTEANDWRSFYGYPVIGVSAMVTNFGNNRMLGQAYAFFPHLQFSLVERKYLNLKLRFGTGMGYINQPFDKVENSLNTAIGSHWNNVIFLEMRQHWSIHPQWNLYSGLSFTHYSNAAFATPNLGINIPSVVVGVQRFTEPIEKENWEGYSPNDFDKSLHFSARLALGIEEGQVPDGPKYPIYAAAFAVERKINPLNKVSVGTYLAYKQGVYEAVIRKSIQKGRERRVATQVGLEVGDELLLDNFGLTGRVGVYLHNPVFRFDRVYTRLGLKYYLLNKHMFLGTYLKAHRFVADYAEATLGVNF
jgi:hypothetical protein